VKRDGEFAHNPDGTTTMQKYVATKTIGGAKLPHRDIIQLADECGQPIMEPPVADLGISTPETEERARLFAASPDLYAFAAAVLAAYDECLKTGKSVTLPGSLIDEGRAAVAKVNTR
jgi:hypothetical protein